LSQETRDREDAKSFVVGEFSIEIVETVEDGVPTDKGTTTLEKEVDDGDASGLDFTLSGV